MEEINPEERFNQEFWWVLQQLKYLELSARKGEDITFIIGIRPIKPPAEPPATSQESSLLKLEELRAIKMIGTKEERNTYGKDFIYTLEIIQPKFDEIYKEYEEIDNLQNKSTIDKDLKNLSLEITQVLEEQKFIIDKIIVKEKERIKNIKISNDHRITGDAWLEIKEILDVIWNKLSPLGVGTQSISVDYIDLSEKQKKMLSSVLKSLLNAEVVTYYNPPSKIASTSTIYRNFLRGQNIIVKDRYDFEDYRTKISEFVNFVQEDGKRRFPEVYNTLSIKTVKDQESTLNQSMNNNEAREGDVQDKKRLKSMYLVSTSVALSPTSAIWLVLDERYEMPIRLETTNRRGGDTAIKKLHNIVYFCDAPGKRIDYAKNTADGINNGLFKNPQVKEYMKTNKFKKPTLVKKSEKETLVPKNEIYIKTILVKHDVPKQYQHLYTDKTK